MQAEMFKSLDHDLLYELAAAMKKVNYKDGEYVIRQGEIGKSLHILYRGTLGCNVLLDDLTEKDLPDILEGALFGESAIYTDEPRSASCISKGSTEILTLSRNDFQNLFGSSEQGKELDQNLAEFRQFRSHPLFASMTNSHLALVFQKLCRFRILGGQRLTGDGYSIFLVFSGTLEPASYVLGQGSQKYEMGSIVGSLSEQISTTDYVSCTSDSAIVGRVGVNIIEEILQAGDMNISLNASAESEGDAEGDEGGNGNQDSKADSVQDLYVSISMDEDDTHHDFQLMSRRRSTMATSPVAVNSPTASCDDGCSCAAGDFSFVSKLGVGFFGAVYLVKHTPRKKGHCPDKTTMCLKVIDKLQAFKSHGVYVKREMQAMKDLTGAHPFIVNYHGCLTYPRHFVLKLEHLTCGDLWNYL
jgi:CRP-like cAMP-binding protein